MHKALIASILLAIVLTPALATAGPVAGTYTTLGSTVYPGKATESAPADGVEGQLGQMIWAESWDGAGLGTEWKLMCPAIGNTPVLILDTVDINGDGQMGWRTIYFGGSLWLSGTGAWAGGDPDYPSTLSTFTTTVYKQFLNFQVVGATTNISLTGVFDDDTKCFDMAIANAAYVGSTPGGFFPGTGPFPPFHGPTDCSVIGSHGTYWNAHDITLIITGDCTVQGAPETWGQLKAIYR
jgi:hypothetical protein